MVALYMPIQFLKNWHPIRESLSIKYQNIIITEFKRFRTVSSKVLEEFEQSSVFAMQGGGGFLQFKITSCASLNSRHFKPSRTVIQNLGIVPLNDCKKHLQVKHNLPWIFDYTYIIYP